MPSDALPGASTMTVPVIYPYPDMKNYPQMDSSALQNSGHEETPVKIGENGR